MSALKKLPPEVARELRRHIRPKSQQGRPEERSGLPYIVAGCVALTATAASFPLIASWWIGNLNKRDDALTHAQVQRGAFMNSGSRDVGKDPDWDFQKGRSKKDAAYYALSEEEEKKLPREMLSLSPEVYEKHKEAIEASARGERRGRS